MEGRGKLLALASMALGLAVLIGAGIAAKDRIAEEWWIYRLRNGDEEGRTVAANRLGELASLRALLPLSSLVTMHVEPEDTKENWDEGFLISNDSLAVFNPLLGIVLKRGSASVSYLLKGVESESENVRVLCIFFLGELRPGPICALPVLERMKGYGGRGVQHAVTSTMDKIQGHRARLFNDCDCSLRHLGQFSGTPGCEKANRS